MEIQERSLNKRCWFMVIVAMLLAILGFWLLSNYEDIFLIGQIDEDQWNRINTKVVERNCLDQAKEVALDEGYDELFVLGCTCVTVQSDVMKTFDCDVNTVDVLHPSRKVLVHCYKLRSQCTIGSDRGIEEYSFDELEELISQ